MLGASSEPICGVRQVASRLEPAFVERGATVHTCWWIRPSATGLFSLRDSVDAYCNQVARAAIDIKPDLVILHYSVFTWAFRGVPVFVSRLRRLLSSFDCPITAFLHEYAVSTSWREPQSLLIGAAQQVALTRLLKSCSACVVTTEQRLAALRNRRSAVRLAMAFLPVPSGIAPMAVAGSRTDGGPIRIGVLGWATPGYAVDTVTGAVTRLLAEGHDVSLTLIGQPGPESDDARAWTESSPGGAVVMTGVLDRCELSRALASMDMLAFPDPDGPASRKSTLAAALAHGLPIIAFDGPGRWAAAIASGAVVIAPNDAHGLALALATLVSSAAARVEQGARALAFSHEHLDPRAVVDGVLALSANIGGR